MKMSLFWIKIVACLDLFAVGLMIPVLSGRVRDIGGSHMAVGLLQSIYAGCQMISGPVIGSLSDIKGCKKILFWTLVICSPIYVVMGLTRNIYVFLLTRIGLGVFKQTQSLAKALVPEYSEQELSAVYGKMAAYTGAGITIGPVIGGWVTNRYPKSGFAVLGIAASLIFLLNAALIYTMEPPPKKDAVQSVPLRYREKTAVQTNSSRDRRYQRRLIRRNNGLLSIAFASFKQSIDHLYAIEWSKYWDVFVIRGLIGLAVSNYYANYTFYLDQTFDLTSKEVGYLISFQAIVSSVSSYFMGFINTFYPDDIDFSLRITHIFIMLTFGLLGLLISWNVYLYTIFLIPLSAGNAMGRFISLEMILTRCQGLDRAALIGVSNSVRAMAGVIAPLNAGYIATAFGINSVIYASLATASLGTLLCIFQRYKKLTMGRPVSEDEAPPNTSNQILHDPP